MLKQQRTLKKIVSYSGKGLHTGNSAKVTFKPAPPNSGIRFKRTDLENCPEILADIDHVIDISRGTTIGQDNVVIHTVEHVLAAIAGLEIDSLGHVMARIAAKLFTLGVGCAGQKTEGQGGAEQGEHRFFHFFNPPNCFWIQRLQKSKCHGPSGYPLLSDR